jgi:hypothetical protein
MTKTHNPIPLFSILIILLSNSVFAQDDYYGNHLKYEDKVYRKTIKTVILNPSDVEMGLPVIRLNSEQKLTLRFDDLSDNLNYYYYTIIHCDAEWNATNISPSEYIQGFTEEQIAEYRGSFNTIQPYFHFQLEFPTEVMQITKSGNYLLKVYQDGNTDNLVLTRRFMVLENRVGINARIHQATLNEDRFIRQEVDFTIFNGDYMIADPYRELKVVIMQNDRWDNAVFGLQPVFARPEELTYDYDDKNVFNGGKEFRYFESRNLAQLQSSRVDYSYNDDEKITNIKLLPDDKRTFKRYAFEQDINGKFVVRCSPCNEPHRDADYVWVHFTLKSDMPFTEGDVYVWGAFSDFQCLSEYRMSFNAESKTYQTKAFLKQGYYNYQYMLKPFGKNKADELPIEGSRWETENDYCILVYHQPIGVYHDRLIGYARFKANNAK